MLTPLVENLPMVEHSPSNMQMGIIMSFENFVKYGLIPRKVMT
jgi:hypothetical protein